MSFNLTKMKEKYRQSEGKKKAIAVTECRAGEKRKRKKGFLGGGGGGTGPKKENGKEGVFLFRKKRGQDVVRGKKGKKGRGFFCSEKMKKGVPKKAFLGKKKKKKGGEDYQLLPS